MSGGTNQSGDGGSGGVGRIAIRYSTSFSGSSSPTADSAYAPNYPYSIFISDEIPTPNAVGYTPLTWLADLNTYGMVQVQTRTGKSNNSTDGTWEDWKPETNQKTGGCSAPNCLLLESADTEGNWVGTNATVSDGDTTRNIDYFEDENETTSGNTTKVVTSATGGYAEATISAKDISSYDYITFWVQANQAGNTIKFGFGESAATEQEENITIDKAAVWQKVYWDITDIPWDSRNTVTKLRITSLGTTVHTFRFDNVTADRYLTNEKGSTITSTPNDYTQYRVVLTTTDPAFKPKLHNVNFSYKTGYKTVQPDNNTVRLYNFTGEEQNVRLEAIVFGADLAEWYPVDDLSIEAGDVVSISGGKDEAGVPSIKKADTLSDQRLMGIISTRAGVELGIPRDDRRLVGLSGRVPVKIAPDSQSIQAGDLLTSSETHPGMAQKATSPGFIVAKALESWDPVSPTAAIESFITVIWADPKVLVDTDGDAAQIVDSEQSTVNSEEEQEALDPEPQTLDPAQTVKILPKVEAEEGVFARLTVSVGAVFEGIRARTAELASAFHKDPDLPNRQDRRFGGGSGPRYRASSRDGGGFGGRDAGFCRVSGCVWGVEGAAHSGEPRTRWI